MDAREIAISLALYLMPSSCLYEESCSSSTTIKPRSLNGKNSEDLAPTTNFIFPLIIFFQIILLFFFVIFETLIHGNAEKIQSIFSKENIKGEFVIIINGDKKKKNNTTKNNDIEKILKTMKRENISGKVASKIVSENFNISKSSAYKLFLDLP